MAAAAVVLAEMLWYVGSRGKSTPGGASGPFGGHFSQAKTILMDALSVTRVR